MPTICPYCGVGCSLKFVVKDGKIVGIEPYKRSPVNEGKVCPKGNFGYQFSHPDGLAKFQALEPLGPVEVPDEEYPLLLTTTRLLFHYHAAMTRRCKTLDNEVKTGYIEINSEDAKELGILNGEIVKAISRRGEIEISARVTDDIKKGIFNIPMHFTECAANMLTNSDSFDPKCKMVELKACAIKVDKIGD